MKAAGETIWSSGRLLGAGDPAVIFGFQHEDASIETGLLRRAGGGRVLCVASGGETAFALLASGASEVVALDANPAQLHLVEAKLAALRAGRLDWMTENAADLLEHPALAGAAGDYWRRRPERLRRGLCFTGTVERRTRLLGPLLRFVARKPGGLRGWGGWGLLRVGVSLGYAAGFRSRLPTGWLGRLRSRVVRCQARGDGGALWSAELGLGFGPAGAAVYSDGSVSQTRLRLDRLRLVHAEMTAFLREHPGERWSLIALSNLIDTMAEREREELIALAASRLGPGGLVAVRSIVHPAGNLPAVAELDWLPLSGGTEPVCPLVGVGRRRGSFPTPTETQE